MSKKGEIKKPEWHESAGPEFSTSVLPGVSDVKGEGRAPLRKRELTVEEYVEGVLAGNRTILAQAITLVESNADQHRAKAQEVLERLLPHAGNAIRLGITGVPGAGKSTFIEALGTRLCDDGKKVAVLAVDPSSSLSKGSILGDKTRMERLAVHPRGFIRPSPSAGTLGGVHQKTRETMIVCEAAGFDCIIVETVGVGQSEVAVRSMVDLFLLLTITGAGDELQNIKKGIIELADLIVVNKADGENKIAAELLAAEFTKTLQFLTPYTEGWNCRCLTASARTGAGIIEIWQKVLGFVEEAKQSGVFETRRNAQQVEWLDSLIMEELRVLFFAQPGVQSKYQDLAQKVREGTEVASVAAGILRDHFRNH